MRQFLAIAALIATGLLPGQEFVQAQSPGTATIERQAPVDVTLDRTTLATALRAAIRAGFPQDVRIRVARVEVDDAGPAQRELQARMTACLAMRNTLPRRPRYPLAAAM